MTEVVMLVVKFGPGVPGKWLMQVAPWDAGAVADMFIMGIVREDNPGYQVCTHSEVFILRIRRRIAEGVLPVSKLKLLYCAIDSEPREIHVGRLGEVDWWPDGVFREALNEVIGIQKAQKPRAGDVIEDGEGLRKRVSAVDELQRQCTFEDGTVSEFGWNWRIIERP